MNLSELSAVGPVDGRYRSKTSELSGYFSEYALIKYRVKTEIEYFIALYESGLPQLKGIDKSTSAKLRSIYTGFSEEDAAKVKEFERVTNHDVKAVEYFIKEKFADLGLDDYREFIHFGLTSQDINNTAVPSSIKDCLEEVYYPLIDKLQQKLQLLIDDWKDITMLAKTHGQPASPTSLGKEVAVFNYRISEQLKTLKAVPVTAKFGGATGNLNAHYAAYPEIDWHAFSNEFLAKSLGLVREELTTQISNYDYLAAMCDAIRRINTVLIDLDRDVWTYISMSYFKQKIVKNEVGSSTMPHKVNPIDFENSEGNLGMANAVFEFLASKLPVSRLQRDLTDSTVLRNIGIPVAHTLIAIKSTLKGLNKLMLNKQAIDKDLEENWAVVTEGIQTILRREGIKNPYELLKQLSRTNQAITEASIKEFIENLDVSQSVKTELKALNPFNYRGK